MSTLKTPHPTCQLLLLAIFGAHAPSLLAEAPKLPSGSTIAADSHITPHAVLRQLPLPGDLPMTSPTSPAAPISQSTFTITPQETPAVASPPVMQSAPELPANRSKGLQTRSPTYSPLCTTLSINQLYSLSGVQQGGNYCFHFEIGQQSKTEAVITEQSPGTDFELYLLKDSGNGNLELMGYSNHPGNADESVLALTPPGHYYWLMNAHASDGSPIGFGALVYAPVDAHEPNDDAASATVLPDTLSVITGNSDSAWDYDYYDFTSVRGQALRLMLTGEEAGTSNRWLLEIYNNGVWQQEAKDIRLNINGLPVYERLQVRVRPNPTVAWTPHLRYRLTIGSTPFMRNHYVEGESNVLRVPYSAQLVNQQRYMTTQAYKQLKWSMLVADSTGTPLKGVTPILHLIQRTRLGQEPYVPYPAKTDINGWARGTINLGTCYGDWSTTFLDYAGLYKNTWRTDYNYGSWYLRLNEEPSIGVGSPENAVVVGHLCQQTLLRSER